MAIRTQAGSLWRGALELRGGTEIHLQSLRSGQRSRLRPRVDAVSLRGSNLRHASSSATASTSSTTLDTIAAQSSEASISVFGPLTPYINQLPELLHLPPSSHSYAISIIAATVFIRTCITLPVSFWQRARMRRLEEMVVPRWEILKKELPVSVAKRSRREKKSYKEYEDALQKELKVQLRALTKQYNCTPAWSIAIPLAVHLPIFICFSLLLRAALAVSGSPISLETIPWWSPAPGMQEKFASNAFVLAERGIEGEALLKLTTIQGPTLSEVDKSMYAPIGLGVLTMANVELGQWVRRGMTSEKEEEEKKIQKEEARQGKGKVIEVEWSFRNSGILGNVLRSLAIGFVIISSQTPAGVVIYWLTSGSYTLAQTSIFAFLDRQRIKKRGIVKD